MYTAITSAVGVELEAHLADRSVLLLKDRNDVLSSKTMGNEPKLRILRRLRGRVCWIRNYESSGTAKDWVTVTNEALIGVVPSAQPVGIGANLREDGIQFTGNRRTVGYVRTVIASGLQLTRAQNALFEGSPLIIVNRGAGRGIRTDQRRVWNRDPSLLQASPCVCEPASHSGVPHSVVWSSGVRLREHANRID